MGHPVRPLSQNNSNNNNNTSRTQNFSPLGLFTKASLLTEIQACKQAFSSWRRQYRLRDMDHNFSIAIDLVPLAQEKKLIPLLALT
jgi:hypothetical protein